MNRADFARGLHELAYFLDAHGELPDELYSTVNIFMHVEPEELAPIARKMAPVEKVYDENDLNLVRRFNDAVALTVYASREGLCTSKVVGKKVEQTRVLVTPPVYEDREVEVDVIEWDCAPLLAPAHAGPVEDDVIPCVLCGAAPHAPGRCQHAKVTS